MTLTLGTGPFGKTPDGVFNFERRGPAHVLYWQPEPRRIRGIKGGQTVLDTRRAHLLHETGYLPRWYVPLEDVRQDLLEPTDHHTHCPFKGDASYWTLRVGDDAFENAAWSYPEPIEGAPDLRGFVSFYWDALDGWLQEDAPALGHPRDPFHRIDVLPSSAHVRVSLGGELVVDTHRARALFETGLPTRWYVPREDLREELLRPSGHSSVCAYKGVASYASVQANGELVEDVLWWYPEPLADAEQLRGHVCFFDERVDVELDGTLQERPTTQWSR
jgi:uncharacterized protein (DUF427 family)